MTDLKNLVLVIIGVLLISAVGGGLIGYRIKKCPADSSERVIVLSDSLKKSMDKSDSLSNALHMTMGELEEMKKLNASIAANRPKTKPTLYNAIRYVNSAGFNSVVDSVLAVPE